MSALTAQSRGGEGNNIKSIRSPNKERLNMGTVSDPDRRTVGLLFPKVSVREKLVNQSIQGGMAHSGGTDDSAVWTSRVLVDRFKSGS